MSGASLTTNGIVDYDCFQITRGAENLDILGSGNFGRFHSSKCHAWVYARSPNYAGVTFFPCGTLNTVTNKQFDYHCQVDSKAAWTDIADGKPQFPGALPDEYILNARAS